MESVAAQRRRWRPQPIRMMSCRCSGMWSTWRWTAFRVTLTSRRGLIGLFRYLASGDRSTTSREQDALRRTPRSHVKP